MVNQQHPSPRRLSQETALMKEFTNARLVRQADGQLVWDETLQGVSGCRYRVAITYPQGFPHERPKAFIVEPHIEHGPHRLADGSLCLFDDPWASDWRCTALVVRNRVAAWILAYEIWQRTGGEWHAPDHEKGLAVR